LRNLFTILIALLQVESLFSQNAPANFITKTVDFGKVKEDKGKIHYDFTFFNKGDNPLRIEKVETSCGCTVVEYTKLAIPKDSSGIIRVTYNTTNRPGEINKSVTVFFAGYKESVLLSLKGIVIGISRLYERELVHPFGNLRFQSKILNMGTVRTNGKIKKEFEFYNSGKKDITISGLKYDTTFLKITINKQILKPKELAKLYITYDAIARRNWGFVTDSVQFITTDDSLAIKNVSISAHLEEYFLPMNAERIAKAPKIKFEKTDQHLGTIKDGGSVSFNYKFINEGQEDLLIRKIVPGCECLSFETPKYIIRPGESSFVRVTMNAQGREGVQNKYVTVISNSPSNPSVNLWMRLNVAY
jgi:hypothetical protein